MLTRLVLLTAAATATLLAGSITAGKHYGKEALVVDNGVISLTVLTSGGSLAKVVLDSDSDKLSPLWDSFRTDVDAGRPVRDAAGTGHFLCVDGFGRSSTEEQAAGLDGHGEAHRLEWSTVELATGVTNKLTQTVHLPITKEVYERTIEMVDGENVVYVRATLESLLGFDRPINWAEHATIGSPFLEPGVTVVDMSANKASTRPWKSGSGLPHRLASGVEFDWPMAPTIDGKKVDLRAAPNPPNSGDHTGHLMTPSGGRAWVTALHPGKHLLLGYIWRTSDYPWLQTWENFPPQGMRARGLEFGTQAFDVSRRETVTEGTMFGQPLYRWLPAKSKIEGRYLMFWTAVPAGFEGVSEVTHEDGKITIRDARSGKSLTLKASQQL